MQDRIKSKKRDIKDIISKKDQERISEFKTLNLNTYSKKLLNDIA